MLTRDELLKDLADFDQQEAKWSTIIKSADLVRADAVRQLDTLTGAKQYIQHLLKVTDNNQRPYTELTHIVTEIKEHP